MKARRLSIKEARRMWQAFQDAKPTPKQLKREGYDEVWLVRG